jgi:hypothetical protein
MTMYQYEVMLNNICKPEDASHGYTKRKEM